MSKPASFPGGLAPGGSAVRSGVDLSQDDGHAPGGAAGALVGAVERAEALVAALSQSTDIPRVNRVFANRNLSLDRVRLVGFDMDYTLALYDQPAMERLSTDVTVDKLIKLKGYPEAIRTLPFEAQMGIRGLLIDTETGNILKPDRYGAPGRGYHGLQALDRGLLRELYQQKRVRLSSHRFAFIDTLFELPEVMIFSALVAHFDQIHTGSCNYEQFWRDIRECIDLAHRDGSIKNVIAKQLPDFVQRDPHLAETLHKMRSSGKKLFLLTNSAWDYTNPVMSYLLDGEMAAYPSWRNFFDIVVVSAMKPTFFTGDSPFEEVDAAGEPLAPMEEGPFVRGRVYAGGNLKDFENRAGARGDRVLFVGDHIYGDMLRSRKSSAWRTAMVIQELELEVSVHDRMVDALTKLEALERQLRHLDGEVEEKQHILRSLQKLRDDGDGHSIENARNTARALVDRLRAELRTAMAEHTDLETGIDRAFNPFWGSLFKEGREVSKFGAQVDDYACVYTSRVSNFRYYSPMRHFRGPRDRMPHEL